MSFTGRLAVPVGRFLIHLAGACATAVLPQRRTRACAGICCACDPTRPPPMKLVLTGVNFDFDKSTLRQEDIAIIDRDAASLDKWGDVKIEVAGHTDSRGSDEYNMKLSQRRAEAVRSYLSSKALLLIACRQGVWRIAAGCR